MKFAWKIFACAVIMIAASLAINDYILISWQLETSVEKEKETAVMNNFLFRYAFETAAANIPVSETEGLDDNITGIATTISRTAGENTVLRISGDDFHILYSDKSVPVENTWVSGAQSDRVCYCFKRDGDKYYLLAASFSTIQGKRIYLENINDVTAIFQQHEKQVSKCRTMTIIFLVLCAIPLFLISDWLTRPLKNLTGMTKRIAAGEFGERVYTASKDEIGAFVRDFNSMADTVEEKINSLQLEADRKERFIADFCHELKTPLTSIIGYADMLRSKKMSEKNLMKSANYIFSEGKRLESLSLKLLDLNLIEKTTWEFKYVNPAYLAESIYSSALPAMEESGIHFSCDVEDGYILIEPELFKDMILNLLDNARKATERGGFVELAGRSDAKGYMFWISDNGRGIPGDKLDKITQAFFMVDKSRSRAQNGAGLGLALCEKIASLHKAQLEFCSCEGYGTVVKVYMLSKGGDFIAR